MYRSKSLLFDRTDLLSFNQRKDGKLHNFIVFSRFLRLFLICAVSFATLLLVFMLPLQAHELWLLTPAQVASLVTHPQPELFRFLNPITVAIAIVAGIVVVGATIMDKFLVIQEVRILKWLPHDPAYIALTACRVGVGILCISAACGLAPRYGTAYFTNPTLFFSDLDLTRLSDATMRYVQYAQIVCGLMLVLNFATRFAACGVLCLTVVGYSFFGKDIYPYLGHLLAPTLVIAALGSWLFSKSQANTIQKMTPTNTISNLSILVLFRIAMGLNFIYLAIAFKIQQPNLLIAIIEGAGIPTFGFSVVILSYIMGIVELTIGVLIVVGIAVRPATLAAIGAMVFFMIVLKEPPHVHANIIGSSIALLVMGAGHETIKFHTSLAKMCGTARDIIAWSRRNSEIMAQKINYRGLVAAACVAFAGICTPVFAARADLPETLFTKLPAHQAIPELDIHVERDASGHIVLDIDAKNYTFAKLCSSADNAGTIASGHAHIYLDNIKVGMVSLPQKDLGALKQGQYRITVSLNDSRHRFLVAGGKALMTTRILEVDKNGHVKLNQPQA